MSGVFLYDGTCGFCTTSARWLQRHAASTARVEAWQQADLSRLGLSAEDCTEALQWVDDGRRAVGPDAVAAYLQTSTHSWQTAGRVLTSPVPKRVAWPVYRWVAHHRSHHPRGGAALERGDTERSSTGRQPAPPVKGIRRRRPKDLDACVHVLTLVYSEGRYPVHWPDAPRAWLDEDVIDAWVLERQGELLGHVAIARVGRDPLSVLRWREITGRDPSELACVTRLYVRPRARGQGIGSALLEVALEEIRARGLIPVCEVVSVSQDAVAFFEDLGWRERGVYPWEPDLQIYFFVPPGAIVP